MSDLMAKCDWYDGTLSVVLPEDPERIAVRMFDSRQAPARLYVPEVETLTLRDENAKLREELAKARDPQRMGGQADPSSFVYAIEQLREFRWQHATNDEDAIPYINNVAAAHERESDRLREEFEKMDAWHSKELSAAMAENEKLRELVREIYAVMVEDAANCDVTYPEQFDDRMRELGVDGC